MTHIPCGLPRRLLLKASIAGFAPLLFSPGTPGQTKTATVGKTLTLAQLVDTSPAQQDVAKDFLIGARAAFQDINARGGVAGRRIQHLVIETDGTPERADAAIQSAVTNPAVAALVGTAGDALARRVVEYSSKNSLAIAHIAPWLQSSTTTGGATVSATETTFPIFAGRQEQIGFAMRALSVAGMTELGVVFATQADVASYAQEVDNIGKALNLKIQRFSTRGELAQLGQQLHVSTPAVLLFVGGTPELAAFTHGLAQQSRQRYVVALADVNLQTLLQMGAARNTPVIATQAVPLVNGNAPVVRSFRETLARLYDEPPTTLSLAGFMAARCAYEVMATINAVPTRQAVLAACQTTTVLDLGGFTANLGARLGRYVTQSMMTTDGRVIG